MISAGAGNFFEDFHVGRTFRHAPARTLGEGDQVGHARHGAVVVHDLADDARRIKSGQAREIDAGFGVAGADQHAALARLGLAQREIGQDVHAGMPVGADRLAVLQRRHRRIADQHDAVGLGPRHVQDVVQRPVDRLDAVVEILLEEDGRGRQRGDALAVQRAHCVGDRLAIFFDAPVAAALYLSLWVGDVRARRVIESKNSQRSCR